MKAKDLRKQTKKDLQQRLNEKKAELIELEFDLKVGQETNTAQKVNKRREIARIMTVLSNEEFAAEESSKKTEETAEKNSKKPVKSDKITKSESKKK